MTAHHSTTSTQRNALQLNGDTLRQLVHCHARAGWLGLAKVLLVDTVHLGEVVHRGQKDSHLRRTNVSVLLRRDFLPWKLAGDAGCASMAPRSESEPEG